MRSQNLAGGGRIWQTTAYLSEINCKNTSLLLCFKTVFWYTISEYFGILKIIMDVLTPEQRKKNMKAIRCRDSKIEIMLRKELYRRGLRYRKNCPLVYGKPDIVFLKKKVAVFCDGEFWHGYNWKESKKQIKTKQTFWWPKIEKNMARDEKVNGVLVQSGWTVLRFWNKEIKTNLNDCANIIEKVVRG